MVWADEFLAGIVALRGRIVVASPGVMDVMAVPKGADIGEHIYCDSSHYPPIRADLMVWRDKNARYVGVCFGCADRAVAAMRRLRARARAAR